VIFVKLKSEAHQWLLGTKTVAAWP